MATKREFEINGEIGNYAYSTGYVQYMMKELGEGPITVKVTSPGGSLFHALKIKSLFEEHGDVTVEYISYGASAATVIGHGAKKTRIQEGSFYMIHKPMIWVNTWGLMNEDELKQAIEEMKAQKKDAETFTLSLADDYVKSRGIELKTVMELLKEARWLSAREAVDLGLVDELIPAKGKKPAITIQDCAIMSAAGLPIPETGKEPEPEPEPIGKLIQNEFKKIFLSNFQLHPMDRQYSSLNQALGVEGVEVKDGKVSLSVDQILALNNKLKDSGEAVTAATQAKETAEAAKKTADDALTDALNKLDAIDPTVKAAVDAAAKVTAIQAKLAERPGTKVETPQGDSSKTDVPKDDADWDAINKLPHNRAMDETDASFS